MALVWRFVRDQGSGSAEGFLDGVTRLSIIRSGTSKLLKSKLEKWGLNQLKSIRENPEEVHFQIHDPEKDIWETIDMPKYEILAYSESELLEDPPQ